MYRVERLAFGFELDTKMKKCPKAWLIDASLYNIDVFAADQARSPMCVCNLHRESIPTCHVRREDEQAKARG